MKNMKNFLLSIALVSTTYIANAADSINDQACTGFNRNATIKTINVGAWGPSSIGFKMQPDGGNKTSWAWSAFGPSSDQGKAFLAMGLHAASLGLKVSYSCSSSRIDSLYIEY